MNALVQTTYTQRDIIAWLNAIDLADTLAHSTFVRTAVVFVCAPIAKNEISDPSLNDNNNNATKLRKNNYTSATEA